MQTKNHAVAVFTLYRTSTHLKKWLLSLPRYEFTFVFYSKRARCISHSSRSFMRARALMFFFLSVAGKFATHVGVNPFTRVAKINRVSRNHREDRRRETDVQNNFFSSQQTTQLTQFSAVSSQFKNRTVAKVRAFRTIWVVFFVPQEKQPQREEKGRERETTNRNFR